MSPTISHMPSYIIEPSFEPTSSSFPSKVPTSIPTLSPTGGSTAAAGIDKTVSPTLFPTDVNTPQPTCSKDCIIHPDDLDKDECPIVTKGSCGGGERGDGICPDGGYCCSEWGWCGTSAEHCSADDTAPTPSSVEGAPTAPTIQIDAGQCGSGNGIGDGFCSNNLCCSDYGYCGDGEAYCYTTRSTNEEGDETGLEGTCGGGGVGDGKCRDGLCCSIFGFCGEGDLYCTGVVVSDDIEDPDATQVNNDSPLPKSLQPEFGFRCGFSEVDARSNCKKECTHLIQCDDGEECWGVQLNYCNTFEEGEHPVCTDLELADNDSRCGYDEASARGHCGDKCTDDAECGEGEYCFPTLINLCECHEETCPEESAVVFAKAKALLRSYFIDPVEGLPRNSSFKLASGLNSVMTLLLLGGAMMFSY